jgi:hypothetical protein
VLRHSGWLEAPLRFVLYRTVMSAAPRGVVSP